MAISPIRPPTTRGITRPAAPGSATPNSHLLIYLLQPAPGASLLDVGCGTGYFSRRFAAAGLRVTGIDPDRAAIGFAREQDTGTVSYLIGSANALPFPDQAFDYCTAITSLCFIAIPRAPCGSCGG